MKVIFITREGYDLAGARIRCYNFARELRKYGLDTEVFSFADDLGAKSGEKEYQLSLEDKLRYNIWAFKKLIEEKNAIFIINRLHYHSFAPWLLHLLQKNRLIFDLDDWEIRNSPKYYFGLWPSSKAEFLTGRIAKSSSLCIASSLFLKNFLGKFNPRVYCIPSGADTDLFFPKSKVENIGKVIISWIGTIHRLDNVENLIFLIECFREVSQRCKNVVLEILGDGIYRDKVIARISDRNIIFKKWITPGKIPEYLSNIDIGVIPLIQHTKFNLAKSPAKLFEYMAMSKAVLCSDIGECSRIVKDGDNGFLAANRKEYIRKLEVLISDREKRIKIGLRALSTIEDKYSLKVIGQNLSRIIKDNLQKV